MYRYTCGADGEFSLVLPPGAAPPDLVCPTCGEASVAVDARTARPSPLAERAPVAPAPAERAAG